jgi:enoyl-CoA hydratase/3-hydroxyacyl-CoA dehydrogenase
LVKLDIVAGVATITINRPEALNNIPPAALHQLQQAFDQASADATVRGIVIGSQGKAFTVGVDIGFFVRNIDAGDIPRIVKFTEAAHALANAIDDCGKPVVARVQGAALGAGTEIALACDVVVASPPACRETSLGIYPGMGGTQRPRKLSRTRQMDDLHRQDDLGCRGLQIGLVDDVARRATDARRGRLRSASEHARSGRPKLPTTCP